MRRQLETERLILRLPRLEDADAWSNAVADPEVMQYIGSGETGDRAIAAQSIERFIERWEANGFGQYAVERRDDGAFLGRLGLLVWDSHVWRPSTLPEAGEAAEIELGWTLLRDYWGHGYATEASAAVREATWTDLEPERLISIIHPKTFGRSASPRRLVRSKPGNHRDRRAWAGRRVGAPSMSFAPLAGVRVVDVTASLAGPSCTQLLAALGADVVKVEPREGDHARAWGPPFVDGDGVLFFAANAGKRSLAVDLEEDLDVVLRFVDEADVFVQSLRPGLAERRGLGSEALRARNPQLVYCTIGAYGTVGPLADRPGYDPLMQAASE